MPRSVASRVAQLERALPRPGGWFDLDVWRAETAEGVPLAEQERRRTREHPERAAEIGDYFAVWRERRAELDALIDYTEKEEWQWH